MDKKSFITVLSAEDGILRTIPIVYSSCRLIPLKVTNNPTTQYRAILPAPIVNHDRGEELELELDRSPAHNPLVPLDTISMDHNYCVRNEPSGSNLEPILRTFNENKDSNNVPFILQKNVTLGLANRRCIVPFCRNNSNENPELRFFYLSAIPVNRELYNIRLQVAYSKLQIEGLQARGYACQEHYYLKEDIIDLDAIPWQLKDDVVPRKLLRQKLYGTVVWRDYDFNVPPDVMETAWKQLRSVSSVTPQSEEPVEAVPAESPAMEICFNESDDEEESEDCMEHCASDSWSDEEVNKTEMTEIATKAASTGRTMRTRRDGPLDVDALIDLMDPAPTVPCKYCSKMFKTELALHTHMRSAHKDFKWLLCRKCSKQYIDMQSYLNHNCVVRIPRTPRLKKKKKSQTEEETVYPFFCKPCDMEFTRASHMNVHINDSKTHSETMDRLYALDNDESFVPDDIPEEEPAGVFCPKCPEWLESDNHLIVHLVNHGLTYKCDVCSETITEWTNIYQHLLTHLSPGYENAEITHNPIENISPSSIL